MIWISIGIISILKIWISVVFVEIRLLTFAEDTQNFFAIDTEPYTRKTKGRAWIWNLWTKVYCPETYQNCRKFFIENKNRRSNSAISPLTRSDTDISNSQELLGAIMILGEINTKIGKARLFSKKNCGLSILLYILRTSLIGLWSHCAS